MSAPNRSFLLTLSIPAVLLVGGAVVASNLGSTILTPLESTAAAPAQTINAADKADMLALPEATDSVIRDGLGDLIEMTQDIDIAGLGVETPIEAVPSADTFVASEEEVSTRSVTEAPEALVLTDYTAPALTIDDVPFTYTVSENDPLVIIPDGDGGGATFTPQITPIPAATPPETDINQLQEAPGEEVVADDYWNVR